MTRGSLFNIVAAGAVATAGALVPGRAAAASHVGLEPVFASRFWLNGRLTQARASGRVVLVDVFTFECINCTRVTPNLKALHHAYSPARLEIVAVHTPEVPAYQARASYVASEARRAQLPWPIALDNDYRIWNAYGIDAWPTQLVFDRRGTLVARIVGESQDAALNEAVRRAMTS